MPGLFWALGRQQWDRWLANKVMNIEWNVRGHWAGSGQEMLGEERVGGAFEVGSCMMQWLTRVTWDTLRVWFLTPSQGFLQGVLVASNWKSSSKRLMPKRGLLAENSDIRSYFRIVWIQVLKPCPLSPCLPLPQGFKFSGSQQDDHPDLQAHALWESSSTGQSCSFPRNLNKSPGPDSLAKFGAWPHFWTNRDGMGGVQHLWPGEGGPPWSAGLGEGRGHSQVNSEHCWQKKEYGFRLAQTQPWQ